MMQYAPFFYKEKFMAKRFYDSKKYENAWFRRLTADLKCVYDYCICNCDHAGILEIDIEDMDFRINPSKKISLEVIKETFENKFIFLSENKIFIPKFIYWQYKNELTPSNPVHRCVYALFKENGINIEQFLAQYVLIEDFKNWLELCKQMKEDGITYKDLLKTRK